MAIREVWFAEEAWISFYQETTNGNYNIIPTHVLKYVQSVTVRKAFDLHVFGQPGAADPDIDSIPGTFECSIAEFFYVAGEQWTPFLDSTLRWRIQISNVNPYYDGVVQVNDSIILRMAAVAPPESNYKANDIQNFSWSFKAESYEVSTGPVITSAAYVAASQGQPFIYQITATGNPTSYNATGLPPGLSVNTTTGLITGTPTAAGQTVFTVSATNSLGTGTLGVTITMGTGVPIYTGAVGSIDFTVPGVYHATPPSSWFNIDDAGLVCDALTISGTLVQPTYQIGTDAVPNLYYGPAQSWELTAAKLRDIQNSSLQSTAPLNGPIRFEILSGATGVSVMNGRGFVRGMSQ